MIIIENNTGLHQNAHIFVIFYLNKGISHVSPIIKTQFFKITHDEYISEASYICTHMSYSRGRVTVSLTNLPHITRQASRHQFTTTTSSCRKYYQGNVHLCTHICPFMTHSQKDFATYYNSRNGEYL